MSVFSIPKQFSELGNRGEVLWLLPDKPFAQNRTTHYWLLGLQDRKRLGPVFFAGYFSCFSKGLCMLKPREYVFFQSAMPYDQNGDRAFYL